MRIPIRVHSTKRSHGRSVSSVPKRIPPSSSMLMLVSPVAVPRCSGPRRHQKLRWVPVGLSPTIQLLLFRHKALQKRRKVRCCGQKLQTWTASRRNRLVNGVIDILVNQAGRKIFDANVGRWSYKIRLPSDSWYPCPDERQVRTLLLVQLRRFPPCGRQHKTIEAKYLSSDDDV